MPAIGPPVYSLVRLKPLNEVAMEWIELTLRTANVGPLTGIINHRELYGGRFGRLSTSSEIAGAHPGQLVEGCSESTSDIGNGISKEILKLTDEWKGLDAKGVIARIRVELGSEGCSTFRRGEKGLDVALQTGSVALRPLQLGHGSCEKRVPLEQRWLNKIEFFSRVQSDVLRLERDVHYERIREVWSVRSILFDRYQY